ncbi:MAG: response regulator [Phycisphaerales bacterium]|nr:response regulator [Phycisphaerales bacterium]MCB9841435.1 response regulator [Phycisphaeraceae bacterium]
MRSGKVLLADDEAHVRMVLARRFEALGCQVRMACDGEQALAMAREEAPDLVITDVQMPHMSGVEFSQALRGVATCVDVPIVMLTARNYIVQDGDLAKARITHVLTKPFSIRKVVDLGMSLLPAGARALPASDEDAERPLRNAAA